MIPFLVACNPTEELVLTTVVHDEDGNALPNATVEVRNGNTEVVATETTDSEGNLSFTVLLGEVLFVSVESPDHVPTAFSIGSYLYDTTLPDGTIWARSHKRADALHTQFAACENHTANGGVVEGEVRFYLDVTETDKLPLVTTAWATAYASDGTAIEACTLDDKGNAKSSPGELTGETGRFAIFGLPEGPTTLEVVYAFDDETFPEVLYANWLPEGGVAPYYPAFVFSPY